MIVEAFLWALVGLPPSGSLSTPSSSVSAPVNHTAWLPITLQCLGQAWTFLSIKWEFVTTSERIPVLVSFIENCSRTSREWEERECNIHKEVADSYQRRVDIFRNGTLVIYKVVLEDAGMYQATERCFGGVKVQAAVNLTVTQETLGSLHSENVARMAVAGLLLCFLGLLVGEHVWATISPRPPSQPRREAGGNPYLTGLRSDD